jgi:hypothetical protein
MKLYKNKIIKYISKLFLQKKTMERLLKKQESKASKVISKGKLSKRQVPLITYRLTIEGSSISLPPGEDFPLCPTKE